MHPAYDGRNSGYSPQSVITKDNLNLLELKWVFQVPGFFGSIPEAEDGGFGFEIPHVPTGIQTVPLIVNGIVYIANDFNGLFAIRAETNDLLWRFSPPIATFGEKPWWNRVFAQHGIDFHDGKVWMQASDCTIYGLDPISGDTLVQIPDTCSDIPGNTGVYFGSFAPLFYNDLIITRPSGGAGSTGERGFIAAYDINTGELVWRWFAVPPTGGDSNWDFEDAGKGNIEPFAGDWGNNDIVGGGSVWSLIALDEESQTIYFPTTAPTVDLDAALRPGPNLFSSSIVALDVLTGEMKWYYQIVPHDINFHESRWSIILTEIDFQGSPRDVVIAGAKTNLVHVLDAESGDPIYEPVRVGPPSKNSINADAGNNADLQASQRPLVRQEVCPGFQGGIDSAPSFSGNTIFVATQTFCTSFIEEEGHPFKGNEVDIIHHVAGPGYFGSFHPGNASLFAIDASNGRIKWVYEIENRQQYGAVTSSGGVVFVPDRLGVVHGVDVETGVLIRKWDFGGLGGAGVSLGATARGEMMLFIASGGSGELGVRTTGILSAFGLPSDSLPIIPPTPPSAISGNAVSFLGFGIAVVAVLYAMVITRRRKK
jgi:glucose dehydrogenase